VTKPDEISSEDQKMKTDNFAVRTSHSTFERARYIMIGGFLGAGKTTCVAKLAQQLTARGLKVGLITNDQGNRITPSYVSFFDSERLIGDAVKNQVAMNPINT